MRDVVLVHGLWMPGIVMARLAGRLRARGYRTHVFAYPGRQGALEDHGERLAQFARELAGDNPIHFIGHSMGGLVVLAALDRSEAPVAGSVVLLGTPVCGCLSARRLACAAPGRWMLGQSRPLWGEQEGPSWRASAPLGVIAGDRPSFGLGRLMGALPGLNDGVVRVDETQVNGTTDRIVLPISHSGLIFSSRVEAHAAHFLSHGHFQK